MTEKTVRANPKKNRTPRHRAREFALQGLYQWLLSGEQVERIDPYIRRGHDFAKADAEYFDGLLRGVIQQAPQLQASLLPLIDRPISQLSPVEHAVLLIGVYELSNHPDIPYRVVINESVELTKSFGGTDGHKYVNGVLDKLAARMRRVEAEAEVKAGDDADLGQAE